MSWIVPDILFSPLVGEPEEDPLRQRFARSLSDGTDVDRLVLLRQLLYRHELLNGAHIEARVPSDTQHLLESCGLMPRRGVGGTIWVRPRQWCPAWLGGGASDPAASAVAETPLRWFPPTPGDAFLSTVGLETYRCSGQRDLLRAVQAMPSGATVLGILPTGAGKSLCAHLPALLEEGVTLLVVPTVALALDQEQALREMTGATIDYAYRGGNRARNAALVERIRTGQQRLLVAAPEAVVGPLVPLLLDLAREGRLRRFIVDEAHLVDTWGDAFRPALQEISGVRTQLQDASLVPFGTVLLSATVTAGVHGTMQKFFGNPGPFVTLAAAQLRPEPSYWMASCSRDPERNERVLEAIHHLPRPLILYTATRTSAEVWSKRLGENGFGRLGCMTGATPAAEREWLIGKWRGGLLDIMVATSAFGMGVDQSDVRSVVHACLPESLDRFYQEVGRGGRDGCASVSLVVFTDEDKRIAKGLSRRVFIGTAKGITRWRTMWQHASSVVGMQYAVNLEASPNVEAYSERNRSWNRRTLTLMARAGLLELVGVGPGRGERLVEPLPGHDDPTVWQSHVESVRRGQMAEARRGRLALERVMKGKTCIGKLLVRYYTLPEGAPALACGGCPACRRRNRHRMPEPMPSFVWPWEPSIPDELNVLGNGASRLYILIPTSGDLKASLSLRTALEGLLQRGVKQVVASRDWPMLAQFRDRAVFTSASDDFLEMPDVPTLFVHEGQAPLDAVLPGPPRWRLHFIPEGARDPEAPHRPFRLSRNAEDEVVMNLAVLLTRLKAA